MEVFQDVEFVRLRSMEHDTYLLDARRASHNAAWAVQQCRSAAGAGGGSGTLYVLLCGAYGRYLGASDARCCPLSCSCRAGGGNLGATMQWAVEVVPGVSAGRSSRSHVM